MHFQRFTQAVSLLILGLAVNGYSQTWLTNGMVAYFPFNGNANDASGNGNNGTPIGVTLTQDRFNSVANAYQFSGTASSYIQVGDRPLLRMTNALTISAWVYQTETTNAQMIVSKEGEYWLGTWRSVSSDPSSHKLYVALETGASPDTILLGNPPPLSKWTQVAVTFNSGSVAAYVNGNLITNLTTGSTLADTDPSRNDFRIGNRQLAQGGGNVEPFVGNIDDVRVYNRALTASEIQQLYAYESKPIVALNKAVKPSFSNLTPTINYQMQVSEDGSTWYDQGMPFTATDTEMLFPSYYDVDEWSQFLFRLQVQNQSFVTNGLTAYYPFSGNGNDFSGNQNSLTLNSEIQFAPDRFGNPSNALQFANGTAFIQSVNNVGISGNTNRTITFWVKHVDVTPWPRSACVQWGNNSASGRLSTLGVNNITTTPPYVLDHAHVFFGGFDADCVSPALTNVSLGQWHHYAFTYTGNLTTASLFLDGVPVTFTQSGVTTLVTVDTPLKLYGGATNSSVDELRIYNRALSASEVAQLYAIESVPRVDLLKAVIPSFNNLTLGENYQSQVSLDLNTWYDSVPFSATSTEMVFPGYYDVDNWDRLFFRLKSSP